MKLILYYVKLYYLFRKDFRPCYAKIGVLGSLFPDVPIVALTATATTQRKKEIETSLGMHNPVIVESSPDRPNIFLESKKRSGNLGTILEALIYELKTKRLEFPLTVIYGNLATVSECYLVANRILGPLQYEPLNSSPIAANRMFTQFHAEYPEFERERIVKELVAGTSKLRLLFVTIAFGIGVDIKNIRRVIHIGVPHTVEEFFQEAGRSGRDGLPASSTVYYNNNDISAARNISKDMVDYVSSGVCKREKLLSYFGHSVIRENYIPEHVCCDIHAEMCKCDECVLHATSEVLKQVSSVGDQVEKVSLSETEVTSDLSVEKKMLLRDRLVDFRQSLHGSGRSCVGSVSLCTGFSMELVEEVVQNANDYKSVEDIYTKLPIFDVDHAMSIFTILEDVRYENIE